VDCFDLLEVPATPFDPCILVGPPPSLDLIIVGPPLKLVGPDFKFVAPLLVIPDYRELGFVSDMRN